MGITCIRGSVFNLLVHLVRYIQQQASPTNRAICDYHFFNTYFYKKLKEAVYHTRYFCFSWFLFSIIKFLFPDFGAVEPFLVGFCKCRNVELRFLASYWHC
jgi:hypothetical protein